jgi:signal transduction histidine kinase/PleD family two-component response regulator
VKFDDGRLVETTPIRIQKPELSLSYPISYWKDDLAQAYWLGEMSVRQNLAYLYDEVIWSTLSQLLSHLFVIACCMLMSVFLGYQIFIKRFYSLMDDLKSNEASDQPPMLSGNSEISLLWESVLDLKNELEAKLKLSDSMLKQCQGLLIDANKNSEMKSHFLAKLSHELRTPMNGLLGFSSLLLESKLEDEQREYAQTIQVSLESLLYVVNDVLDLSRIESGDLNIISIPFNLRGVVSGVSMLLQNRAESKGLSFESRISPDIAQTLRGDPVRIRQVLMNLVSNAIEHTEHGYILINLELLKTDNGRANIRLSIEDSGSKPPQRTRIDTKPLDMGFATELRGKRSLGLDVCYQLVELMGSKLSNESRSGNGSTYWFEINLPVMKQDQSKEVIDLSLAKKLNVLVVDSYELSRKITLELLQEWGIKFEAVATAGEGINLLKSHVSSDAQFNMVLCDDLLQDLSGIEACQIIRQTISTPLQIVVLCSNPQLGDAEGFFLAGANGFLSKQLRDPYLRSVMCQTYSERDKQGSDKRLITRYTVNEVDGEEKDSPDKGKKDVVRGNVLIVEDNIVNQQLVMRMLHRNGCQVDLASNGVEGVELFKKNQYDLIFMDCLMPEMDGYETTQIIREIERSNVRRQRTPIVALTAHAFEEVADRCFQVGMDEFMTKPFKIAQLEMVLDRHIN